MSAAQPRYCIVLPKGIGDVVLGLAVATALKRQHPRAHLTWVTYPPSVPLLEHHGAVDQVIEYRAAPLKQGWRALRTKLREESFDVLINLGMYMHALPPLLFARARRVVGLGRPFAKDGLWLFQGENVKPLGQGHTQDQFFRVLDYLGVAAAPVDWSLTLTDDELVQRDAYRKQRGAHRCVGMVVTSGRPEKDWPVDRFVELALRLHQRCSATTLVLGGPGQAEAERAESIVEAAGVCVRNELGPDLRRLMWLMTVCDVVIAPDTGPVHIARSLAVPLVALYGHTDPRRYGPYQLEQGTCLDRYNFDASGSPSAWRGRGGRPGRMGLIRVDEVESACLKLLDSAARPSGEHPAAKGERP